MKQLTQNKSVQDLIKTMEGFFAKAPALPTNIREIIVKITPWLALIFGILGVLGGLGAIGISPVAMVGGVDASAFILISGILAIVSSILMLVAYPKLKANSIEGWTLLFISELISVVSSLISGAIIGAVIGGLIGFYFLFQIKSYYK